MSDTIKVELEHYDIEKRNDSQLNTLASFSFPFVSPNSDTFFLKRLICQTELLERDLIEYKNLLRSFYNASKK